MMRIPGYGRFAKRVSKQIAHKNKEQFINNIHSIFSRLNFEEANKINIELMSFSGFGGFWDQIFSMMSWVKNVGVPKRWIIYSDKCHSEEQKSIFSKFPFVTYSDWDVNYENDLGSDTSNFSWQIKKFISFSKHFYQGTTIFSDSDILFYPSFKNYLPIIKQGNWFLPEPSEAHVIKSANEEKKAMYNFNAGFFILEKQLDFSPAISYLYSEAAWDDYFSDQEALNIIIHNLDHVDILDPRVFYLTVNDHFKISHASNYENIAMRHFVGPVRQKMWQRDWKKTLHLNT